VISGLLRTSWDTVENHDIDVVGPVRADGAAYSLEAPRMGVLDQTELLRRVIGQDLEDLVAARLGSATPALSMRCSGGQGWCSAPGVGVGRAVAGAEGRGSPVSITLEWAVGIRAGVEPEGGRFLVCR
jgi:hypothetical protein